MMRYDLLADPLITIRDPGGGEGPRTLPQILESLAAGENLEFPALRPHQQQPWYCFLVQLATLALHRSENRLEPFSADYWRSFILDLTGNVPEAFWLIVEDFSKPAFLQPPVPEGSLKGFEERATPDELDILVTSKNHDLKTFLMCSPRPEHWLFSLLTLQTLQGYSGQKRYGIVRMNKGLASRPFVGFAASLSWSDRFRRDVGILLDHRPALLDSHGFKESQGKALLWLEPWDGIKSLELHQCDPFFIEVCRRVRLLNAGNRVSATDKTTVVSRIASRESHGDTGDPWTPIHIDEAKALTVGANGFNYELVRKLLFTGDYRAGACQVLQREDPDSVFFVAGALARKQGGTEGLHRRVVPIPSKARYLLDSPSGRERLDKLAGERVTNVADWKSKVLRPSLCALLQGRLDRLDLADRRVRKWDNSLDGKVDRIFFAELWADADLPEEDASRKWNTGMMALVKEELEAAAASMPLPAARRFRGEAFGWIMFNRCAGKHFSNLFNKEGGKKDEF